MRTYFLASEKNENWAVLSRIAIRRRARLRVGDLSQVGTSNCSKMLWPLPSVSMSHFTYPANADYHLILIQRRVMVLLPKPIAVKTLLLSGLVLVGECSAKGKHCSKIGNISS